MPCCLSWQQKNNKKEHTYANYTTATQFGNDIPHIAGNADYAAEKELLETMDEIISQSGLEEMAITSFLEIAVFDKAARLFAADKPIVFRLTEKEKLAVQERAMVALRVAILRKQTGDSLRRYFTN